MELDHVFVLCASGAPEADALVTLGLTEGSSNSHPGQGTACRRFFFDRLYLELLWVTNPEEVRAEPARITGLWERWSGRHAQSCPFGIIVTPSAGEDVTTPPFDAVRYEPRYVPPDMPLFVATDAPIEEPLCIWMGVRRGAPKFPAQPLTHRLGNTVTDVTVGMPSGGATAEPLRLMQREGLVTVAVAESFVLDVTIDGGEQGRSMDLRPVLPLRLRV